MTITIPQQNIKMDVPTGIDPVWYGKLQALITEVNTLAGNPLPLPFSGFHASLPADVPCTATGSYFDGPSIAQGTTGTWWVSGTVTLSSPTGDNWVLRLWDGTNIVDSGSTTNLAGFFTTVALSGFIAGPVNNLKISVRDISTASGKILFSASGNGKDSTISAFRIA